MCWSHWPSGLRSWNNYNGWEFMFCKAMGTKSTLHGWWLWARLRTWNKVLGCPPPPTTEVIEAGRTYYWFFILFGGPGLYKYQGGGRKQTHPYNQDLDHAFCCFNVISHSLWHGDLEKICIIWFKIGKGPGQVGDYQTAGQGVIGIGRGGRQREREKDRQSR